MIRLIRNLTIGNKLLVLLTATAGVAVLVMGVLIAINQAVTLHKNLRHEIETLAKITALGNQAPLRFNDRRAAGETLAALKVQRDIVQVQLFDRNGKLFAEYRAEGNGFPQEIIGLDLLTLNVSRPVVHGSEYLGMVRIVSDLSDLWSVYIRSLGFVLLATLIALIVAATSALRLRRIITEPIARLSQATRTVSAKGDYSLRVEPGQDDELGILIKAFNGMLLQIQVRDDRLAQHGQILEHEVKHRTAELINQQRDYQIILDSVSAQIFYKDRNNRILRVNKAAADAVGLPAAAIEGKSTHEFFPDEADRFYQDDLVVIHSGRSKLEIIGKVWVFVDGKRQQRWMQTDKIPYRDEEGEIIGVIVVALDITERKAAEEALLDVNRRLEQQATTDALTGLINRYEIERRLQRVLEGADQNRSHALLYLDLDQFKLVNDTCGHAAGDELLRRITQVLETQVRKRDTLARLGGDEFAVLLEHCPLENAIKVAEGLLRVVEEFRFGWEDKVFRVGVSIGLVPFRDGIQTVPEILSAADRACYLAKDRGRHRLQIYTQDDEDLAHRSGQMLWIPRLTEALGHGRFRLYAQTVVPLNEAVANAYPDDHYEILIRLADPREGLLLPGAFIPAAERYQQISRLDRWVVKATLAVLAAQPDGPHYAVNLSGQSLGNPGFLAYVLHELERSGVAPERFGFEITETAAVTDLRNALKFMTALKERGCRFGLDDVGSGLSSFGYLRNLPVDYLKIDGSFVRDIATDPFDHAVVLSIHRIAQVLGIKTVAESIESELILERVRAIGIDFGQGYGIAPPMPLC